MTVKKAPAKKPRRKRKRSSYPGRPPAVDTVRVMPVRKHKGAPATSMRITFSQDVVKKLIELHDRAFRDFYYASPGERESILRFRLGRLADMGLAAIFVAVEPPSYDPQGYRVRRQPDGRRYTCTVINRKLGIRDDIVSMKCETLWLDNAEPAQAGGNGLIVSFPDEWKLEGKPDLGRRKRPFRRPEDMTVPKW